MRPDIVVGVPEFFKLSAAMGFTRKSGLPNEMGLVKPIYTTHLYPANSKNCRSKGVPDKLSAVSRRCQGKAMWWWLMIPLLGDNLSPYRSALESRSVWGSRCYWQSSASLSMFLRDWYPDAAGADCCQSYRWKETCQIIGADSLTYLFYWWKLINSGIRSKDAPNGRSLCRLLTITHSLRLWRKNIVEVWKKRRVFK